ncbi:fimbrial protein [Parabacteroides goldsteinii]|uniref:fimbrial protein n=1 Tax=Parabacteroides goldsteinii TaxID=328812 RepID=UPI003AB2FA9F
MKTVFLSMLAIAALASCSRQEFIDSNGGPQEGDKMLVDITLGNGEMTKATGVPGADGTEEKTITDITVFFLNGAGQIVSRTFVTGPKLTDDDQNPGHKKATVETRTTASQVMVIANIGGDRTGTGEALNVSTKAQLEAVLQDLVFEDGTPPALVPFQEKGNLLMSGIGDVSQMAPGGIPTDPFTAEASVDLKYIAAKITLKSITVTDQALGKYGDGQDFVFTKAYLLNVQTKSHYFPTYLPAAADLAFANGTWEEAWGTSNLPTVKDFEEKLAITSITPNTAVENLAHWYVFENKPASTTKDDNPTILAVQIKWKEKEANGGDIPEDVYALKNFNVIFAPGDKGIIEAGKAYDVALSFSGDFRPGTSGGNAGGGEDKPDEPNIKANVTVTVTPAEWDPAPTEKPFE